MTGAMVYESGLLEKQEKVSWSDNNLFIFVEFECVWDFFSIFYVMGMKQN